MAAPGTSDQAQRATTVVVVTGGDPLLAHQVPSVPAAAAVVAADSGIEHAHRLGLHVDVAVGDFDSVDPAALALAEARGASVRRHPRAKDATDLELALDVALELRPDHVVVLGGHGGRLDHLLANVLLLASERFAPLALVAQMGDARVSVVRDDAALHGAPGDVVTLLAPHGPATVRTEGLRYPLHDEVLAPGSTRGVSNELVGHDATVHVSAGVLLAVQPVPATDRRPHP